MPGIFRAYDIRGTYGSDITPRIALRIGMAFGSFLGGGDSVVIAKDARLSSPILKEAFVSGLLATGCHCIDLGMTATPVLYFASINYGPKAGVMITASHNPPDQNGMKLCRAGIAYSYETCIGKIEAMIRQGSYKLAKGDALGRIEKFDAFPDYAERLLRMIDMERGMKIVLDAGNGVCGFTKHLFEELGCQVDSLYAEPDGRFPNHLPDPLREETLRELKQKVREREADVGIAFDGDGDRVGFVDEMGRSIRGDQALAIFAREVLRRRPGSKIVFNVLCSRALVEDVEAHGGIPKMSRTGHSYVQELLIREGAPLAGELSGHFYFADGYYGYDDGILAALKMVEILSKESAKLSEIVETIPRYEATPELRVPCPDERKFRVVEALKERLRNRGLEIIDLDGVRVELPQGWGIVRASNTEPALVMRFEAKDLEGLSEVQTLVQGELKTALRID
ncbi:phosphomannomutase/phosphoglucomutase [Candidatus Bathyarchaeota archaeon]|nr:phosphomannomutase/phosphoglucomutase [Candidatus Bathyarchaeota archaeon]MBS7627288.1 phosphomannomutase/phosphoglucomutase [Candidatus Bathyarchaeota archaeon]